jgi:hypothetical protein
MATADLTVTIENYDELVEDITSIVDASKILELPEEVLALWVYGYIKTNIKIKVN